MTLAEFHYECAACREKFTGWDLPGNPYGVTLARSMSSDQLACFDVLADAVFKDVTRLIENTGRFTQVSPIKIGELANHVLNRVCDVAPDGSHYLISVHPTCPRCRSREMASWQEVDPPKYREVELPCLPHEQWDRMTPSEKQEAVKALLPL